MEILNWASWPTVRPPPLTVITSEKMQSTKFFFKYPKRTKKSYNFFELKNIDFINIKQIYLWKSEVSSPACFRVQGEYPKRDGEGQTDGNFCV